MSEYENHLIREATGQGREFEMSLDEAPPAQENIVPNETSNHCQHELGLHAVCRKCGAWPIATNL